MFKEWNERGKKKPTASCHAGLQQRDPELSLADAIYCHSTITEMDAGVLLIFISET